MRRSVVLGWALAASLAVNAGLGGYLIAQKKGPRGFGPGALRAVASELSSEGRATVRAAAKVARPELRAARNAMRAATGDVVALIGEASIDPAEKERRLAAARDAMAAMQGRAQRLFFDAAEGLSPEDRAIFAETLTERLRKRGGRP